jgi:hypothetical protein
MYVTMETIPKQYKTKKTCNWLMVPNSKEKSGVLYWIFIILPRGLTSLFGMWLYEDQPRGIEYDR